VVLSLALQHGTPIETIRHAVTRSGSGAAASILGAIVDVLSATARGAALIAVGNADHADFAAVEDTEGRT
jgi:hypothetical protein